MATINSSNQDYKNNADGFELAGGTTKRKLTVQSGDAVMTGAPATLSLTGNLTTSGANPLTLTANASTNVTLPTSGTLATLSGTENLTNKKLVLRAGSATAGTAPLKLTSGSLMTSAEAGAVEFNTNALHFTPASGVRKTVAAYPSTGGATGDIYYRNASGNFTPLSIGSTGHVLKLASGLPSWGATTSPQVYEWNIDNPADAQWANSLGYDDEFSLTTSSIHSPWTWMNQGSNTYSESFGAACITTPGSPGSNIRGITRAYPSQPSWVATTKTILNSQYTVPTSCGMFLRNASTGKMILFSIQGGGVPTISVDQWTNNTTSSSTLASVGYIETPRYLRIICTSSTSYSYQWSCDGAGWYPFLSANNHTGFFTPDQIGLYLNRGTTASGASASFHWFRIR